MSKQNAIVAVAIGAIIAVPLQFLVRELGSHLIRCCISEDGGPTLAYNSLYVANAAAALIPGFIAGWLGRQRGMLLGFLAGFIASVLLANLPRLLSSVWQADDLSELANYLSAAVFTAFASGLYAGAAGGAAELLRTRLPSAPVEEVRPIRYGVLVSALVGILAIWIAWWIYEALFPPSHSEMSAGHSLSTYFLFAAANLALIVTALTGFAIMLRSHFR